MDCNSQLYINKGIRIGVKSETCHNECMLLLISNFISFTGHRPNKIGWARTGLIDPTQGTSISIPLSNKQERKILSYHKSRKICRYCAVSGDIDCRG